MIIEIDNTDGRLMPGMSALVTIRLEDQDRSAEHLGLQPRLDDQASVFVNEQGKAVLTRIQVGLSSRNWSLVERGLSPILR